MAYRGGIRKRPSKSTTTITPLHPTEQGFPIARSYWRVRQAEAQETVTGALVAPADPTPSIPFGSTDGHTDTNVDANIASNEKANADAIINRVKENSSSVNPSTNPKSTPTSIPTSVNEHRYKGLELIIISTQVIWNLLDHAWKHSSCTMTNIIKFSNWWPLTIVTAVHQLTKQQVWLLAFAEYKWWQALESQWQNFEALPDKDRVVLVTMREVRSKKESKAARAEKALITDGLEKDVNAVHVLPMVVKKEKVDGVVNGEGEEKSKLKGKERQTAQEGSSKRARIDGKEAGTENVEQVQRQIKDKVDDGLSSDSDEDDDDDEDDE
jgi:hypothetical protein